MTDDLKRILMIVWRLTGLLVAGAAVGLLLSLFVMGLVVAYMDLGTTKFILWAGGALVFASGGLYWFEQIFRETHKGALRRF